MPNRADKSELYERKVLKIVIEDTSYTFFKPDSDDYKDKVLVLIQDAHGEANVEFHTDKEMSTYLRYDQYYAVMNYIHKPVFTIKGDDINY